MRPSLRLLSRNSLASSRTPSRRSGSRTPARSQAALLNPRPWNLGCGARRHNFAMHHAAALGDEIAVEPTKDHLVEFDALACGLKVEVPTGVCRSADRLQ